MRNTPCCDCYVVCTLLALRQTTPLLNRLTRAVTSCDACAAVCVVLSCGTWAYVTPPRCWRGYGMSAARWHGADCTCAVWRGCGVHDAVERTYGVVQCDGRLLDAADTTHTCADTVVGACDCDCNCDCVRGGVVRCVCGWCARARCGGGLGYGAAPVLFGPSGRRCLYERRNVYGVWLYV